MSTNFRFTLGHSLDRHWPLRKVKVKDWNAGGDHNSGKLQMVVNDSVIEQSMLRYQQQRVHGEAWPVSSCSLTDHQSTIYSLIHRLLL